MTAALAAVAAVGMAGTLTAGCNAQGGTSDYRAVGAMPEDDDPPPAMRSDTPAPVSAAAASQPTNPATAGG